METKTFVWAAVTIAALTACDTARMRKDNFTTGECDGTPPKCTITVKSLDSWTHEGQVDIDGLRILSTAKNVWIRWKVPAGCRFVRNALDGMYLKFPSDDDGQFTDAGANDDEGSTTPQPQGRVFFVKDANTKKYNYPYGIKFHCGNVEYKVDPLIMNDG